MQTRAGGMRGGKSGLKKSRGVASMILGVPIPDRIKGIPNKGRSKMVQEKTNPKQEGAEVVDAEQRLARNAELGEIETPEVSPWLQTIIKDYFLTIRQQQTTETEEGSL
jgi:hypothetical protein